MFKEDKIFMKNYNYNDEKSTFQCLRRYSLAVNVYQRSSKFFN